METISTDILTLAAIVASIVGVAKTAGLPAKFAPLAALLAAAIVVLLPEGIRQVALQIAVIGLAASGAYEYVGKKSA